MIRATIAITVSFFFGVGGNVTRSEFVFDGVEYAVHFGDGVNAFWCTRGLFVGFRNRTGGAVSMSWTSSFFVWTRIHGYCTWGVNAFFSEWAGFVEEIMLAGDWHGCDDV